jgi:hypothetical protein
VFPVCSHRNGTNGTKLSHYLDGLPYIRAYDPAIRMAPATRQSGREGERERGREGEKEKEMRETSEVEQTPAHAVRGVFVQYLSLV